MTALMPTVTASRGVPQCGRTGMKARTIRYSSQPQSTPMSTPSTLKKIFSKAVIAR